MGLNVSNEFTNTANQLQGIMGQLGSLSGNSTLGGISSITGSVFDIANCVDQIQSGDSNARANGIMNLIDKAMGLLDKLGNIQAKVEKKVKDNSKKAEKLAKEAEATEAELNKSIEDMGKNIDVQSNIVTDATAEMTKAQEQLAETQDQINEIIKQIEEKQSKLAEAQAKGDINTQKTLLEEIYTLGLSIADLSESTIDIQESFDTANQTVTDAYTAIETAKGNAIKVQNDGQKQIVTSVQDATEASKDTALTQADGVKNIAAGEALIASSSAAVVIPGVGAALSSSNTQKGTELISAGTKETTGSVKTFKDLGQGINQIKNNANLIKTFDNVIGGSLKNFDGLIGSWNGVIEPFISSFGTFTDSDYTSQAQSLGECVQLDKYTIAEYEEQNPVAKTDKTETQTESNTALGNTDKKPEYELETPRFKFGI